jgi:hypothetical protein
MHAIDVLRWMKAPYDYREPSDSFANAFPADNAVSTIWRRGHECARVVGFPRRYWSRYRAKRMQGTKAQSSSRSPLNPGDQCRAYARARRRIAMSREGLWRRCRSFSTVGSHLHTTLFEYFLNDRGLLGGLHTTEVEMRD